MMSMMPHAQQQEVIKQLTEKYDFDWLKSYGITVMSYQKYVPAISRLCHLFLYHLFNPNVLIFYL
jgi:hypothetical protein